jgi:hydroxymethylglutaryl-CoA lyase
MNDIKLIECPRDAMQGWKHFIPTDKKISYINALLKVGFHTIDFGSFVSPKAIPQMADTKEVLAEIDINGSHSKLLAIVANVRGAEEAVEFGQIDYLGFPFSVSPTFQQRNANSTIEESLNRVQQIQEICVQQQKQMVVYLSMGFGNPYGDLYNEKILIHWADKMVDHGIKILSLADTVGLATPEQITLALETLIPKYPGIEIGVHLHSAPHNFHAKLKAATEAGCKRFDGALKGIGGCPMAQDELIGNMNTEKIIDWFRQNGKMQLLNDEALDECLAFAGEIFE